MQDFAIDDASLRHAGVRLVVLFGSRAKGSGHAGSDVDLAVLLATHPPALLDGIRDKILAAIDIDGEKDLVFLNEADPLLLHEVATTGRPLFQDLPGAFEEFRLLAVKRYYDTAWIRKIEAEALRRRYA